MEQPITHYDRLGVSHNATRIEIRTAYKRLAQRHHPDRHQGSAEAVRVMTTLNVAYGTLMDAQKRQSYDTKLHQLKSLETRKVFGQGNEAGSEGDRKAHQATFKPINPWEVKTSVKVIAIVLLVVAWLILRK
jgi:DnaJ-class molecular chaperone